MKGLCLLWLITGLIILDGCGPDDECDFRTGQVVFFDIQDASGQNVFSRDDFRIENVTISSEVSNFNFEGPFIQDFRNGKIIGLDVLFLRIPNESGPMIYRIDYGNGQSDILEIQNGNALQLGCNIFDHEGIVTFTLNSNSEVTIDLSNDDVATDLARSTWSSTALVDEQGNLEEPFVITLIRE